jgi:hypothetical protein
MLVGSRSRDLPSVANLAKEVYPGLGYCALARVRCAESFAALLVLYETLDLRTLAIPVEELRPGLWTA